MIVLGDEECDRLATGSSSDQLTTVSTTRLSNKMGQLSKQDMAQVEHAIKIQLDLG